MTVEKPKPKQLLRPITTGANSAMNKSEFLLIASNSLKGREKSRVHGAIGFGFASHWLKNWRESFKPITKRSNRNHVITFDSHLKTALYDPFHILCRPLSHYYKLSIIIVNNYYHLYTHLFTFYIYQGKDSCILFQVPLVSRQNHLQSHSLLQFSSLFPNFLLFPLFPKRCIKTLIVSS